MSGRHRDRVGRLLSASPSHPYPLSPYVLDLLSLPLSQCFIYGPGTARSSRPSVDVVLMTLTSLFLCMVFPPVFTLLGARLGSRFIYLDVAFDAFISIATSWFKPNPWLTRLLSHPLSVPVFLGPWSWILITRLYY